LVRHPEETALVRDERVVDGSAFLRDLDALQPFREAADHVLLPEALRADAARVALERDGAAADVGQHRGGDRLVVGSQLALGDAVLRAQPLPRVRDPPFSSVADACPSPAIASRRGWRSFPCAVHSMKATFTTTVGRTQCAPARGSPEPRVNGGTPTSRASR